jgi:hypothetical protein
MIVWYLRLELSAVDRRQAVHVVGYAGTYFLSSFVGFVTIIS